MNILELSLKVEFDTEDQVLYHMQYQHLIYHISDTAPALHISCLIRSTNIYISHIFYIGTTSCISYNAPISYLFLISYASPTSHISYAETISYISGLICISRNNISMRHQCIISHTLFALPTSYIS